MNATVILQIPLVDTISNLSLAERLTNECDVKWIAGYRLAGTVQASPMSVILIFQLRDEKL